LEQVPGALKKQFPISVAQSMMRAMKVAVFNTKRYERRSLDAAAAGKGIEFTYLEPRLDATTAVLAAGHEAVLIFVNDVADRPVLEKLAGSGTKFLATRSAGFNQIDRGAARSLGILLAYVPAYSPNAVAEFTIGLILTLGRHIHEGHNRVRRADFNLEGLCGFELRDKTVGVCGTGRIGTNVIRLLNGFGCNVLAYDEEPNEEVMLLASYVDTREELFRFSDILTLHVPLMPSTFHLIDAPALKLMKDGVFIINTSRGALLDTPAVVEAVKSRKVGFLAIDVYEEEASLFFEDRSSDIINDDVFARLLTFPNVIVTGHQAFLTDHALRNIAETTVQSLVEFDAGLPCTHLVPQS
jgi:D-lactate dehydrogenase